MNDSSDQGIGTDLEVRIVAWVLGEVSDFERAELSRIAAERPEVAEFRSRIEAVHGLIGETYVPVTGHAWKLGAERRQTLCHELGIPAEASAAIPVIESAPKTSTGTAFPWLIKTCAAAAVIALAAVIAALNSVVIFTEVVEPPDFVAAGYVVTNSVGGASTPESLPPLAPADAVFGLESAERAKPAAKQQFAMNAPQPEVAAIQEADPVSNEVREKSKKDAGDWLERKYRADGAESEQVRDMSPGGALSSPIGGNLYASAIVSAPAGASDRESKSEITPAKKEIPREPIGQTASRLNDEKRDRAGGVPSEYVGTLDTAQKWDINGPLIVGSVQSETERQLDDVSGAKAGDKGDLSNDKDASKLNLKTASDGSFWDGPDGLVTETGKDSQVANVSGVASGMFSGSSAQPQPTRKPAAPVEEISVARQPFSTFSLHVSDVSFQLAARALLGNNQRPEPQTVRTEEFVNAFRYRDPAPAPESRVSCSIEQAAHPFLPNRNLVRCAIATESSGRTGGQPLHLTVLLDTSGSMEREDRRAALEGAVTAVCEQLTAADRVTLIGFSRQPRLLADRLTGDQAKTKLVEIVRGVVPEGGTNLEEAMRTGSDLARRQFQANAQNRVVLITDGAANLGNAKPKELARVVEELRGKKIAFDACGIVAGGLNDEMLETLTRNGDGRYYLLENAPESVASFSRQLAGAFRPAAKNVKVQVRFNPARVSRYKLFGFEKHELKKEDFKNDKVDAAELAKEEAGVALYQVEFVPGSGPADGEIGEISVRYQDVASATMVERSWTIPSDPQTPAFDRAPASIQLAGTAALLAETLRGSPVGTLTPWAEWKPILTNLRAAYNGDETVQKLVQMVELVQAGR